ncbi:MAG: nucleotidyltransferase family protein [Candidatus Edwardsbacteria bacterium]|nr:nucleotidyltransferase family protein [Candidatus Edwardsbacteria bacterium]
MATVAAIVLAAGTGGRIGCPKLFLKSGGKTFLELVINILETAGLSDITVVVRGERQDEAVQIAGGHAVRVNQHPENGPLSSLRVGLDAAPGFDGYLVMPVDHPFVKAKTVRELVSAFAQTSDCVIKPSCQGKAGHPVIVPIAAVGKIPRKDSEGGLARIIKDSGAQVRVLETGDGNILRNINQRTELE